MNEYKESLQAIRDGVFFDWIGNNGDRFTKDELIRFIKEYEYAVHKSDNPAKLREIVLDSLEEMSPWSDGE